jgi:TetR/AcrR family fatty acid metabolism transcriptional regulator
MPVLGRTKKDVLSEFRKSELLIAARAVFGKKGFHDASIEEIAEMAEVAKGTVYLYYKSKKDLYLEALRFGIGSLVKELKARADTPGSCLDVLRVLTHTKIVFFEENRDFFRIYYSELGKLPAHPAGISLVRDLYAEQAQVFERVLREGMKRREVRNLDIEKTAYAIADLTRGIATQRLLGMSKTRLEDDVEFILNVIWKGIAR